jgi:hypothetical protein
MKVHAKEIGFRLIDCGSARKQTRGLPIGFFREGAPPPYNLQFHGV